jgi:hypothetical protein
MKLEPWPFEDGEILTLIATQTPYRCTSSLDNKKRLQWYFEAIFVKGFDGTGMRVTITFPWALFPVLRCGDQYQAGQRLPQSSVGGKELLDLTGLGQPKLERMDHNLPPYFQDLLVHTTFSEFMFVWQDGSRQIMLPVLEMLRAVFLKNDTFAKGILDPIFLGSIGQWRVNNKILEIQLRDTFPLPRQRSDRNEVLRVLAYLFCENSFFASFQNVGQNRVLNPTAALKTTLPSLASQILCHTYSDDQITFIWHIEHVAAGKTLDIQAIYFTHPKHLRRDRVRIEKQPGGLIKPGGTRVVDIRNPPIKPGSFPKPIIGLPDSFFDDLRLKVKNVGPKQKAKPQLILTLEYNQEDINLSFGPPEQSAIHQGAFIQIVQGDLPVGNECLVPNPNWQQNQKDGFDALREMLKELQRIQLGPQIIPGRSKPMRRPYMIVHLQAPPLLNVWLLEFQQASRRVDSTLVQPLENEPLKPTIPKNDGMSTMILTGISFDAVLDDVTHVIQQVIQEGLQSGYHWDNERLERLEKALFIQIRLVKHTNNKPDRWAKRILSSG